jgi:hypothetical protein
MSDTTSTSTVFTPSQTQAFSFQAVLDGDPYTCVVTWSLYARRWYLTIYDSTNTAQVVTPLISSIPSFPINLVFGFFQESTLVFYDATQTFVVTP